MKKHIYITTLVVAFGGCIEPTETIMAAAEAPTASISNSPGAAQRAPQNGLWERHHANGALAEKGTFVGGRKHGVWLFWYPDSSIYASTVWLHGQPALNWSFYMPGTDEAYAELRFENGRLQTSLSRTAEGTRVIDHRGELVQ